MTKALSVVLAVTEPWPAARPCLMALLPQAQALGVEVIIADATGRGVIVDEGSKHVVVLRLPGASPYRCRAEAIARATGDVIAVTEDHCVPGPTYCADVIEAHRRAPDVAVIGGSVHNGAREAVFDEASFFIANTAFVRPIAPNAAHCIYGQANVSFKREFRPTRQAIDCDTLTAMQLGLRHQGARFALAEQIEVLHAQRLPALATIVLHFDDARCRTCLVPGARLGVVAAARCVLKAPWRIAESTARLVARVVLRKPGYRRSAIVAAPAIAVLLGAQVIGEIAGLVAGPGRSPSRMH